jgi:hypothetical protein
VVTAGSSSGARPSQVKVPAWALQPKQPLLARPRTHDQVGADGLPHELEWRAFLAQLLDSLAGEEHGLDYQLLFTAFYQHPDTREMMREPPPARLSEVGAALCAGVLGVFGLQQNPDPDSAYGADLVPLTQ